MGAGTLVTNPDLIRAAVKNLHASVSAATAGHPARARYLSDLADRTYRALRSEDGDVADLNTAIEVGRDAIGSTPPGQDGLA